MPLNKKGGNKTKKQKNSSEDNDNRELSFTDIGQQYAKITEILGNKRYRVNCFVDNAKTETRLAHARGNLKKKKVFIKKDDFVIVSLRTFQDDKCDIIHVYNQKEIPKLVELGEIPPETFKSVEELQSNIDFVYEEEKVVSTFDTKDDDGDKTNDISDIDFDLI